jgi:hypothetical protein
MHRAPLLELLFPHNGFEPELVAQPPDEQPQPALSTLRLNGGIRNGERDKDAPGWGEAM